MNDLRVRIVAFCAVTIAAALFGVCSLLGYWIYINQTDFPHSRTTGFDALVFLVADDFGNLYQMHIPHVVVVSAPIVAAFFLFRRPRQKAGADTQNEL